MKCSPRPEHATASALLARSRRRFRPLCLIAALLLLVLAVLAASQPMRGQPASPTRPGVL